MSDFFYAWICILEEGEIPRLLFLWIVEHASIKFNIVYRDMFALYVYAVNKKKSWHDMVFSKRSNRI